MRLANRPSRIMEFLAGPVETDYGIFRSLLFSLPITEHCEPSSQSENLEIAQGTCPHLYNGYSQYTHPPPKIAKFVCFQILQYCRLFCEYVASLSLVSHYTGATTAVADDNIYDNDNDDNDEEEEEQQQ